jgi:hypothetical protein
MSGRDRTEREFWEIDRLTDRGVELGTPCPAVSLLHLVIGPSAGCRLN